MGDTGADAAAYKEEGNNKFKSGDFRQAAELYAKAIDLDPSNAVLYRSATNAALCVENRESTRVQTTQRQIHLAVLMRPGLRTRKSLKVLLLQLLSQLLCCYCHLVTMSVCSVPAAAPLQQPQQRLSAAQ
jgi:tetratricopeptide (TPR) repeat protein